MAAPATYPRWNSAVRDVRPVASGRRYRMERDLPSGRAENLVEVVSATPPEEVVVRASQGPTPFTYRYRFTDENGGTMISLSAEVDLGGIGGLLGPFAARTVRRGVDANFESLKRLLEA
ncbi:MAG: SRPBCC family protein [Actinomycetota bacterium]|nr:SRPBCC family protein [Actinomycetota bacterium]